MARKQFSNMQYKTKSFSVCNGLVITAGSTVDAIDYTKYEGIDSLAVSLVADAGHSFTIKCNGMDSNGNTYIDISVSNTGANFVNTGRKSPNYDKFSYTINNQDTVNHTYSVSTTQWYK